MTQIERKWSIILYFVVTVLLMHTLVVYTYFYHDITGTPRAIDGSMDLSGINPAKGKTYLDGQWEFYWKRFIVSEPEQYFVPDLLIPVPDSWSDYQINGERLSAEGFGSYRLTLTGLEYDKAIALYIPDLGCAYRVFIDGQIAAESGTVSKHVPEKFTSPKASVLPVTLTSGNTHVVVIEVATTRFSGLYMTPVLGDYTRITTENSNRRAFQFILFGTALFSMLTLLMLYAVPVRQRQFSAWLPVMTMSVLLRLMLTSEFYSFWQPILFFNLSYESTNELMYLATFVLKYLLMFLVEEQCRIEVTKKEKIGFLVYYAVLYFVYLLAPQGLYNQYMSVLVPMLTYVLDLYLFIKMYHKKEKLDKLGILIFWGAILVMAGLTMDSYYINGKIFMNMSLTLPLLFTVFSLVVSWVYSMRTARLYAGLQLANNQLDMQKEYYGALSEQMNTIREIKHDIRHFIGVMGRLAEDRRFDELREFLKEYGVIAEMEQLPVFSEHVVANSIVGYYYLRAKEKGVLFESRVTVGRQSVMSDSDLCIVLGNALENAIEACQRMDSSEHRFISIEMAIVRKQLLIRVQNSYSGSLTIMDGRFRSSKPGKSSGFGIRNIEKVVESYGGSVWIEHNESIFTLMAAVPECQFR